MTVMVVVFVVLAREETHILIRANGPMMFSLELASHISNHLKRSVTSGWVAMDGDSRSGGDGGGGRKGADCTPRPGRR